MNILIVCHYGLYKDLTYSFVHNQAREYAALGHRVRVIIPNGIGKQGRDGRRIGKSVNRTVIDDVEMYDLRYLTLSGYGEKGFNAASAIAALRVNFGTLFRDFKPDVVHAHTLGFDSRIGAWLKGKFSCPLVVTTHGSDTNVPLAQGRLEFLRNCCDAADRVMAVSSVLADNLRSCGTKTVVGSVLNGFNVSDVRADVQKIPMRFVQVSNLLHQKRVNVTIEAFAKIKENYPCATLTIVGSGPEQENLERLCSDLGISDSVEFTGRLPNHRSLEEMAKAQFFVMLSVREGFGIVYAEAMASGCITIGTQGEGVRDLITHGKNGFLAPADEPDAVVGIVCECLENPDWASNIAKQGEQAARGLTWKRNAQEYIALFEELLLC